MTNFILGSDEYENMPALIFRSVPAFLNSIEYAHIIGSEVQNPDVVVSAFVQYLIRLQKSSLQDSGSKNVVEDCYRLIEELALIDNYKVKGVVLEDMLAVLREEGFAELPQYMGPVSKKIYNENFN